MRIIPIDPDNPDDEAVDAAAAALESGKMIIYPTETYYGLGVTCDDEHAVQRLFKHKNRAGDKPVPVIVSDREMVSRYAARISRQAAALMERFWPGPLTLVFPSLSSVPPLVTGGTGTIGIRAPGSAFCRALARKLGGAVTATSANYPGEPPCSRLWDIPARLRKSAGLLLHGGETGGTAPSTVLSVCADVPVILRMGAVSQEALEACLGAALAVEE